MLNRILKYFTYLGLTGFGGPLALIQQMRTDLVEKQKLVAAKDFDQAFTLIKAMPGPIAFQMAIYCGRYLNGFWGAFWAGFGLLFPAFIMMLLAGIFYVDIVDIYPIQIFFKGMQYAVAAVILYGLKNFVLSYKKSLLFWCIAITAASLFYLELVPESLLIVGFGLFVAIVTHSAPRLKFYSFSALFFMYDLPRLKQIFLSFFEMGALVFGTGLAIFPFVQAQFVNQLGWMNLSTFNDAATFGQMTPGPVTISTVFMGYQMAGFLGSIAAILALLLPPFFHMVTWFPYAIRWLGRQTWVAAFLLGSTAAVVGCITMTVYNMNVKEILAWKFWFIFIFACLILWKFREGAILKLLLISGIINLIIYRLNF